VYDRSLTQAEGGDAPDSSGATGVTPNSLSHRIHSGPIPTFEDYRPAGRDPPSAASTPGPWQRTRGLFTTNLWSDGRSTVVGRTTRVTGCSAPWLGRGRADRAGWAGV